MGEAQGPEYEDAAFEFGRTYVYSVRAFVRRGESAAVTPLSAPAEIAATDRFPPGAPENVRTVVVPGAVEISWSPNEEEDLAGYQVYRSEGDGRSEGGEFARVNPEALRVPVFRDATVRPGVQYRYEIRAADRSGNESEPSEAATVVAE